MASFVTNALSPNNCDTNDTSNVSITSQSAWGSSSVAPSSSEDGSASVSFQQVMNEQLAGQYTEQKQPKATSVFEENPDTTSDEMLAKLLQLEFDQICTCSEESTPPKDEPVNFEVGFKPFTRPVCENTPSDEEDADEDGYGSKFSTASSEAVEKFDASHTTLPKKRLIPRFRWWESSDSKPNETLLKDGNAASKSDARGRLNHSVVCRKHNACRILSSK